VACPVRTANGKLQFSIWLKLLTAELTLCGGSALPPERQAQLFKMRIAERDRRVVIRKTKVMQRHDKYHFFRISLSAMMKAVLYSGIAFHYIEHQNPLDVARGQ